MPKKRNQPDLLSYFQKSTKKQRNEEPDLPAANQASEEAEENPANDDENAVNFKYQFFLTNLFRKF